MVRCLATAAAWPEGELVRTTSSVQGASPTHWIVTDALPPATRTVELPETLAWLLGPGPGPPEPPDPPEPPPPDPPPVPAGSSETSRVVSEATGADALTVFSLYAGLPENCSSYSPEASTRVP